MSNAFRKQFGEVWIPFPKRLNIETIKEVRIHLKYKVSTKVLPECLEGL